MSDPVDHNSQNPAEYSAFQSLEHVFFQQGQCIRAEDLNDSYVYFNERARRHNRLFHGCGVVSGLEVSTGGAGELKVSPGVALDRAGNEIVLEKSLFLKIPDGSPGKVFVAIGYEEKKVMTGDPQPQVVMDAQEVFNLQRIRESGFIKLLAKEPEASSVLVPLAALLRDGNKWLVDLQFARPEAAGHTRPMAPARPAEESPVKVAWYFRTSLIVLCLLTVGPFALPLIWFHPSYSRHKKIILTVIILVLSYFLTTAFMDAIHKLHEYYQQIFSML